MKNKFGARKSIFNGRMYDSKGEMACRMFLDTLVSAGEITDIVEQRRIHLHAGIHYHPDFDFEIIKRNFFPFDTGQRVYVDYKGFETEGFRLKCKLWKLHGQGPLVVIKKSRNLRTPFAITKTIMPEDLNDKDI